MEIGPGVPLLYYHIFSSAHDHKFHVRFELSLIHRAGVTFNLKKFSFFTEIFNYLGHDILSGILKLADHTTDAVLDLKPLCNIDQWKSSLGFDNIYHSFVLNFSTWAAPLSTTLRNCEQSTFGTLMQEEQNALAKLQDKLVSAALLPLPRCKGHFTFEKDVHDSPIGCVLIWYRQTRPHTSQLLIKDAERGKRRATTKRIESVWW